MARGSVDMNFLFTLGELQRLVRLYADKQAARYGITRAQWAVLAKVERSEGLKQTELAELMEMQPITLTRLIDKLCDNGWIERRGDETDRRVNRLYLRKAARPLLGKLADHTSIEHVFHVCSFLPLIGLLTAFLPNLERTGTHIK